MARPRFGQSPGELVRHGEAAVSAASLTGLGVFEFGQGIAGPYTGFVLACLGARITIASSLAVTTRSSWACPSLVTAL
jgi:crotonobetainyl-CoA:carnitine CoA-transferase CaiB-like acyl-CoA transferase